MSTIKQFLDDTKPLVRRQFICVEEDWELIGKVFPEHGFPSFLLGHFVSKFANQLRKNAITTYHDREDRLELATAARVLSGIQVAWPTDNRNDGSRVGDPRETVKVCDGNSSSAPSTSIEKETGSQVPKS